MRIWHLLLLGGLVLASAAGCEQREAIAHYRVEKPPPIRPVKKASLPEGHPAVGDAGAGQRRSATPTHRTLGAIVPVGEQGWFFKLTGPKDAVAANSEEFFALLKSLKFADGKPSWTLPPGWEQRPGSDIRFATLVVPSDGKPLELTVIPLPKPPGDEAPYLLANINRWRDQLALPPIAADQLAEQSTSLPLAGITATVVDLVGSAPANTMGRPPFMSPGARNGN